MFEKFTEGAREVVLGAARHADDAPDHRVGERELLFSLLDRTGTTAAGVLARLGAHDRRPAIERDLADIRRRGGLSRQDTEALAGLGIDVGQIVERVERTHGVGALAGARPGPRRRWFPKHRPFSAEAKAVLVRSLRIAGGRGEKRIGDEHILLALTARPSPITHVLADHGVTYVDVERALEGATRGGR
ncbi:Clp protease N-terminal domain-containing protein [Streptomyces sp. NPDC018031]|uniref:Clp protease N-terminal domain-containing protein n=1 Tax=Streptomyces sp. NPDC018031 TaxID=3365033 RepID=UPI00378D8052